MPYENPQTEAPKYRDFRVSSATVAVTAYIPATTLNSLLMDKTHVSRISHYEDHVQHVRFSLSHTQNHLLDFKKINKTLLAGPPCIFGTNQYLYWIGWKVQSSRSVEFFLKQNPVVNEILKAAELKRENL